VSSLRRADLYEGSNVVGAAVVTGKRYGIWFGFNTGNDGTCIRYDSKRTTAESGCHPHIKRRRTEKKILLHLTPTFGSLVSLEAL
jgi:hypothetical protein